MGHQRTLFNLHPHPHAVHSPQLAFPAPLGPPIPEENMHQLAYISPSMMTTIPPHAPVYQYRTPPDLVPAPSPIFPSSVSAPTSPSFPRHLINTSPLPDSPTILRHALSSPLRSVHHSPPNAMPGAYTPMGYTYAYPSPASFVPAPSIYGSHSPPSHYTQPYSFPTGQENQGMWWYSPPGSITPLNPVEGAQREFQPQVSAGYPPVGQFTEEPPGHRNTPSLPSRPQPTRRLTNRTRVGRPLNDSNEEAPQAPSVTSRNQERRSYHPNPPAHRSDWVMWAGNVPANVTQDELREFFDQLPDDGAHVYGGVLTVFLISRSNCAFVNFESEAQLEAATARFNGQSIRPDDQRCPRLVCRVRRKEDDLMAGVGAQRGSGMHIKWVKEQRARVQREQSGTVGSPRDMSDMDLSVQKNMWATQRHNEEILDQAYRTSKDVFLIFSVNKSGEFFGYARMAGLVLRDESGMPWGSATGFTPPSESSSSENSAGSSPSPDDTGVEPQDPLYILPPDVRPVVTHAPQSAPAGRPSFLSADPHKPYDRLANSMPNITTSSSLAIQASSSRSDALCHSFKTPPPTRPTRESAGHDAVSRPHEVPGAHIDDRSKPVSEVPFVTPDTRADGTVSSWDRPFRIEWVQTNSLPFGRTQHIRNPWNHSREVKVSRDGTELEPGVGRLLLDEWYKPSIAVDNSLGPSRRRGQKSTKRPN